MSSKFNAYLLSAVMLTALLQCAVGAPVEDESIAGDTSGEEGERPSDLLSASPLWDLIIASTKRLQIAFEEEFHNEVKFYFLESYKISSLPVRCPKSNFSKEACLHRLVQGLLTYTVLLKHVEREHPSNSIPSEVRFYSGLLINLIKDKMKNPEQVTALASSQEEQLLRDIDNPDTFHRKMIAFKILCELYNFLVDCKRVINKREKSREVRPTGVWNPSIIKN